MRGRVQRPKFCKPSYFAMVVAFCDPDGPLSAEFPSARGERFQARLLRDQKLKVVMRIRSVWKLVILAMLSAIVARAPTAIADDIDPDADIPDISTLADPTPTNQVLEVPQQCGPESVAVPCNRSVDDGSSSSDAYVNAPNGDSIDFANNPDAGSVYDYANQNTAIDASAGAINVPYDAYVPGYAVLSPAPTIVSPSATGPGSYQQWAPGPGSFQQRYVAPQPLGYRPYGLVGGFGRPAYTSIGGNHFGRR